MNNAQNSRWQILMRRVDDERLHTLNIYNTYEEAEAELLVLVRASVFAFNPPCYSIRERWGR